MGLIQSHLNQWKSFHQLQEALSQIPYEESYSWTKIQRLWGEILKPKEMLLKNHQYGSSPDVTEISCAVSYIKKALK